MSAAETGQMSSVETRQMSCARTDICLVSTHNTGIKVVPMPATKLRKLNVWGLSLHAWGHWDRIALAFRSKARLLPAMEQLGRQGFRHCFHSAFT